MKKILPALFLLCCLTGWAADSTIHNLPVGSPAVITDRFPVDRTTGTWHNYYLTLADVIGATNNSVPNMYVTNLYVLRGKITIINIDTNYDQVSYITNIYNVSNLYSQTAYITNLYTFTNTIQTFVTNYFTNFFAENAFITNIYNTSNLYSQTAYITNLYAVTQNVTNLYAVTTYATNLYSLTNYTTNLYAVTAYTTNLYALTNYVTNLYANTAYITNLYAVTNLYALTNYTTNLFVNTANITNLFTFNDYVTNLYSTYLYVTNAFTQTNYVTNLFVNTEYVTNLYANTAYITNLYTFTNNAFFTNYFTNFYAETAYITNLYVISNLFYDPLTTNYWILNSNNVATGTSNTLNGDLYINGNLYVNSTNPTTVVSNLLVGGQVLWLTNVWVGPTNPVDISGSYDQNFAATSDCSITGITNKPTIKTAEVLLSIYNTVATNITVRLPVPVADGDYVSSHTITNGTTGYFWLRYTPVGPRTNCVFRQM